MKESLPKCKKEVPGCKKNVRKRCLDAKIFFYRLFIMTRRVTIFVALFYSKEIAETSAMDAVALKVYELKSKCLFYEYLTSLFEKNIT